MSFAGMKRLETPFSPAFHALRPGDGVLLSGVVYTARDAAHKRLVELIKAHKPLPLDLNRQAVFYAGPCPTPPGRIIGSIGPTTSMRMDPYTPCLLEAGVRIMIGKGSRGEAVEAAIREYGAVYLTAIGGAAAFMARCVTESATVAFEDLGTEAIRRLVVRDLPLFVSAAVYGANIRRAPGSI